MRRHLVNLIKYTQWRHDLVYHLLSGMQDSQQFLFRTFGCLYFGTPKALLDHLLVSDEFWQMRLTNQCHSPYYQQLCTYWSDKHKFNTHWPDSSWLTHYRPDTQRLLDNYLELIGQHSTDQSL